MLVELSYYPEQVRAEESAFAEYKSLYDDGLAALHLLLKGEPGSEWYGTIPITTPLATSSYLLADELLP